MQHVLERPRDGAQLDLAVGDEVILRLDQQSSGGHLGSLSEIPDFLAQTADEVAALDAAPPGRLHTRVLGLRATGTGEGQVVLTLKRPWESAAVEVVRLRVTAV